MATQQPLAKRDPSSAWGAIATATVTTIGLLLLFLGVYQFVIATVVIPNLEEPTLPRFERDFITANGDSALKRGALDREVARREAERSMIYKGCLLVSPLLAGGYASALMVSSAGSHPLLPHGEADIWLWLVALSMLFSLPFAIAAYIRQRTLRLGWPLPWAIFVLLFGPLGWVAYRVHRRWPLFLRCEHCANQAPQHLDECLVCGEKFPPPAPTGTEIFA